MICPVLRSPRPRAPSLRSLCVVAIAALTACPGPPEVGEFGRFRYVGRVVGEPPMTLLPPVSDGSGAVYTLFGTIDVPQASAFVSRVGGGEVSGCNYTKGDRFGPHGWVGFTQDRQWYWSGDALVEMTSLGGCRRVLDRDPGTDVDLQFKGVLPWVRDAPSRPTLVALVKSLVDPRPFSVVVDLNANILTDLRPFEPGDATDVTVIGVGARREANTGAVLLSYGRGGETVHEGRFYDATGEVLSSVRIRADALPEYGVTGYLQIADDGLAVGLLRDGNLVAFDRAEGRIIPVDKDAIQPVGVHRWQGALYLVGTAGRRPVIAEIGAGGRPGRPSRWEASELAASALTGSLTVLDDRSSPARQTTWTKVRSAIGEYPFLSAHSPTEHAPDTTLWLVAGPSFDAGGVSITSFAMAPVGIAYP